jgi:hypothetical protein
MHQKNRKEKKLKKVTQKKNSPPKNISQKNISPVICFEAYSICLLVFSIPLPRNAQKRTKKKKKRYVRTLFCELAQMYVVFSFYFFCRPLFFCEGPLHRNEVRRCRKPHLLASRRLLTGCSISTELVLVKGKRTGTGD